MSRHRPAGEPSREALTAAAERCLYREQWLPLGGGQQGGGTDGHWLVFADRHGIGDAIAQRLEKMGRRCTRVVSTSDASSAGGRSLETWDARSPGAVDICYREAAAVEPVAGIVYLWSLDADTSSSATAIAIEAAHRVAYENALALLQAVVRTTGPSLPTVHIVTSCTQAPNASAERVPLDAGLWGLARVAAREHPELSVKCIDLDSTADSVECVLAELRAGSADAAIAWCGSQRFGRRLVPDGRDAVGEQPSLQVKSDRTYLITGGMGSLGVKVAEWLVGLGARHLLLTGRSEPSAAVRDAIAAMESGGARVRVERADVADAASCAALFTVVGSAMPHARGRHPCSRCARRRRAHPADVGALFERDAARR